MLERKLRVWAMCFFWLGLCSHILVGEENLDLSDLNYVFRKDHNTSFSLGRTRGQWLIGSTVNNGKEEIIQGGGNWFAFSYEFHLQLFQGLGYFLGSSIGSYFYRGGVENFNPSYSFLLPSFLGGLVYNFDINARILVGGQIYLEVAEFSYKTATGESYSLNSSMLTKEFKMMFDYFYKVYWALRLELAERRVESQKLKSPVSEADNIRIEKKDRSFGLGVVYHFF